MRIEWAPAAVASARRYLRDQDELRAVGEAVASLADDPYPPPPAGFHRAVTTGFGLAGTGSCTWSTTAA